MGRVYVLVVFLLFSSCIGDTTGAIDNSDEGSGTYLDFLPSNSAISTSLTERFFNPGLADQRLVDSIYAAMSLEERASQMIMVSSSSVSNDGSYPEARELAERNIAGSVVFLKGKKSQFARQAQELNELTRERGQYPLLYACDCEPSLLHKKWTDVEPVASTSSLLDAQDVRAVVQHINASMRDVSATLNFAPVVDIGVNRSVISDRSFGNSSGEVVAGATEFVRYTQAQGIAATIKHFPGHGAVKGDSHKGKVFIDGEMTELNNFKTTIEQSRPVAVMVGHITVKNNDPYNTRGVSASVSPIIVTQLLKRELAYEGLIVTDAMNMKAVSSIASADWKAVEAGVDLVVMPRNPVALNKRIVLALQGKDAFALRLESSIKKVILLKLCTGVL
jgi:beta-N-acetylhexosaminidase